ncbi:MAG: hypothetical protein R3E95_06795 [Thiolinea sp.]
MSANTIAPEKDRELIEMARDWEDVAEVLDLQNSALFTITDALAHHAIAELDSIQKLLENAADELYTLFLKCEKKHKAITRLRFPDEEVANG